MCVALAANATADEDHAGILRLSEQTETGTGQQERCGEIDGQNLLPGRSVIVQQGCAVPEDSGIVQQSIQAAVLICKCVSQRQVVVPDCGPEIHDMKAWGGVACAFDGVRNCLQPFSAAPEQHQRCATSGCQLRAGAAETVTGTGHEDDAPVQ